MKKKIIMIRVCVVLTSYYPAYILPSLIEETSLTDKSVEFIICFRELALVNYISFFK